MTNGPSLNVGLVFDDTLDSNDGVAQYVKAIGTWLTGRGHTVSYLVGETKIKQWSGGSVYSLAKNQTVYFNGNKLSMPLLANGRKIRAVLADNNYDVLHVMVPYSPMMASRVIAAADSKTVVIGTFHILPSGKLSIIGSKLLGFWLKRNLKRFDQQISASSAAKSFAKAAYGINSLVIPNTVDVGYFRRARRPKVHPANHRTIFFLGRLVKRKGAAELIKAYNLLKRSPAYSDVKLVIASDGPDRAKLEAMVEKFGLKADVEFLGFIDEKDKPSLLAGADIACFPSLYGECFGIVLIEAMAAGSKVVLGGNNPGYASVLSDQPMMLVDPTDTNAFAERLSKLLTDRPLIEDIHKWQDENIGQYDINVVGKQIEDQYISMIARRAKKSNNEAHE